MFYGPEDITVEESLRLSLECVGVNETCDGLEKH